MTPTQRLAWRRVCNKYRVARGLVAKPEDAKSIAEFDKLYGTQRDRVSDMEWQSIETFDYKREEARQRSIFVWAIVTDGQSVVPATHWGFDSDPDDGWHDETRQDYNGPEKLGFEPTHWMPLPAPPVEQTHDTERSA